MTDDVAPDHGPSDDVVPPRETDRADFDPAFDPDNPILCDICGSGMDYTASCRIICRNCGYTRDCSDP